jgi:PhoH-like ATPase
MKKFILDTNVFLHDPQCLDKFENCELYITFPTLEELDKFKTANGELGHNCRSIIRKLDELRQQGALNKGVKLDNKVKLTVLPTTIDELINVSVDNKLLLTAKANNFTLITKDINLRIKGDVIGVKVEDYKKDTYEINHEYIGYKTIEVDQEIIDFLYDNKKLVMPATDIFANEYVKFVSNVNNKKSILGKYVGNNTFITIKHNINMCGITSRNLEQAFAFDALMDDDIKLVALQGLAGSGKTLISLAAALDKVLYEEQYNKIVVTRPIISVGKELGFLPGSCLDKMEPWMKPIYDALDKIIELDRLTGKSKIPATLEKDSIIEVAPLSYIRGRSIEQAIIIVEEVQNLTPHEIKTLITRVGEGSKIILNGDIGQIDTPYLDSKSNALAHVISKFQNNNIFAYIKLLKSERSKLAELAARML